MRLSLSLFRQKNCLSLSRKELGVSPSRTRNRVSLPFLVESAGESRSLNDRFGVYVRGLVVSLDLIDDSASLYLSSSNPPVFLEVSTIGSASVSEESLFISFWSTTPRLSFSLPTLRVWFFISPRRRIEASLSVARRLSSTVANLYLSLHASPRRIERLKLCTFMFESLNWCMS